MRDDFVNKVEEINDENLRKCTNQMKQCSEQSEDQ